MTSIVADHRLYLSAVSFAARAHRHQVRKDGRTPYVAHVFRVALVLRHIFGIDDPQALTAALLHDTIEDTTTDYDDLEEQFGGEIATWVALLSKDTRKPEITREEDYLADLLRCRAWQVRVCKLADMFDNLMDLATAEPAQQARTLRRMKGYLDALGQDLPDQARKPYQMVASLYNEIAAGRP